MTRNWRLFLSGYVYRPILRLLIDILYVLYRPRTVPRKFRVLHVAPEYFADESHIGGGSRYPLELARAMADLTPTRVVSFGRRRSATRYGRADLQIYSDPSSQVAQGNPVGLGVLRALLGVDVIHCHQFNYRVTVVAIVAGAILRLPIFVSDLGGGATSLARYLRLERFVCRFLNISRFAERQENFGKQSTIIYGGVDTDRFVPPDSASERPYFLYVGRLLPHKGIDVLIEAVGEDMPLVIAGRPYHDRYYPDLKRLAEGKQVQFRIDVDDASLVELYRGARAVILPSVYTDMYGNSHEKAEYLGLTMLEGMACGAPAVCTLVGGMPEIVRDEVTGFVVPPNDPDALRTPLLQLWNDPALAAAMGTAAASRVRAEYTWHKVAQRCLAAYAQPCKRTSKH